MSPTASDYRFKFILYSSWILNLVYGQDSTLNNFDTLTGRLWLYNSDMACPTNVSSSSFLARHPGYINSTEHRPNATINDASIWVKLPQKDVLFYSNVPSTFHINFLCNPSVKSPIEKCPVGNCLVLTTTQLDDEKRSSYNIINITSADSCNYSKWLSLGIVPKLCLSLPPRDTNSHSSGTLLIFIITVLITIVLLYFLCGTCCNYISGLRGTDSIPHINCLSQVGECLQNLWYKIKCCDKYRGPYQEI